MCSTVIGDQQGQETSNSLCVIKSLIKMERGEVSISKVIHFVKFSNRGRLFSYLWMKKMYVLDADPSESLSEVGLFRYCSEEQHTLIKVLIWREENILTTY